MCTSTLVLAPLRLLWKRRRGSTGRSRRCHPLRSSAAARSALYIGFTTLSQAFCQRQGLQRTHALPPGNRGIGLHERWSNVLDHGSKSRVENCEYWCDKLSHGNRRRVGNCWCWCDTNQSRVAQVAASAGATSSTTEYQHIRRVDNGCRHTHRRN